MCGPKGKGLGLFGLKTGIFESSQEKALNISHFLVTKKNISIFRQNSWVNNGRPIQSVCNRLTDCYIMVIPFSSSMAIYR